MRVALTVLVAALLAVGLVACGGSDDNDGENGEIADLTERFESAIARRDAKAFCALLAPNDVLKLGQGESSGKKKCLEIWGKGQNPLFEVQRPKLEIENVSYEGDYATAELSNGGELGYAKERGRWYVHLAPERRGS